MVFDNQVVGDVNFTYVPDPVVWDIQPKNSFKSGGRVLTVTGLNLLSVQTPKLRARTIDGKTSVEQPCRHRKAHDSKDKLNRNLTCRSPMFHPRGSMQRIKVSFVIDDVGSVRDLPSNISVLLYYPDPTLYKLTETLLNTQVIIIKGEHLDVAATAEDVQVLIGCEKCNVTTLEHNRVICNPPTSAPKCNVTEQTLFPIKVSIGFLKREVGQMEYEIYEPIFWKYIPFVVGVVAGVVLFLLLLFVLGYQNIKKSLLRARLQQEREDYEHKFAKMEGRYRNQWQED